MRGASSVGTPDAADGIHSVDDFVDENDISFIPSLVRHNRCSFGRRTRICYLRCRESVPGEARVLYEDAYADLVQNCEDKENWWNRYVIVPDSGELLCRFAQGTHVGFLLADHLCRKARRYGLLRSEVYKDYRSYIKHFDWSRIIDYASRCWNLDHQLLHQCMPDGYAMNTDSSMQWNCADGSFIDNMRRKQASLVAYAGGDLTGIAHSLCKEGTSGDVVNAMLRRKPFFEGREHTWREAYIFQMNREIDSKRECERAEAYVRGCDSGGMPGHAMVYFYDHDDLPTARLPGAVEKFLVIGPLQTQRNFASVVRAPYDLILEDGLVVVATTKKRIFAYLQGVPGKESIIGMLKGGKGLICEASVAGTIAKLKGEAKFRLERLHWFWGRWLFNVLSTMQAVTVCNSVGAQIHLDLNRWAQKLIGGESSKKFLARVSTDALARLPVAGEGGEIDVALSMVKKVLGADEAIDVEEIQDKEVARYTECPRKLGASELLACKYVREYAEGFAGSVNRLIGETLSDPEIPFSPGATQTYGRKADGLYRF